ncbi:hypothetical protein SAMN05421831_108102 [Allopseudospirillum japonicum]|uniref:Uncharacterized protein n=1 Tax=Allopseudospirillum japonicum TaxID=64971 RepID=A0A1H6T8I2_9GAMM|nr:hypothetical protein [Allopseudospirillum japonicum]SEI72122.1 hypothetical protein SAMN05421831_108102 [Allopseudospirillum japonicum]
MQLSTFALLGIVELIVLLLGTLVFLVIHIRTLKKRLQKLKNAVARKVSIEPQQDEEAQLLLIRLGQLIDHLPVKHPETQELHVAQRDLAERLARRLGCELAAPSELKSSTSAKVAGAAALGVAGAAVADAALLEDFDLDVDPDAELETLPEAPDLQEDFPVEEDNTQALTEELGVHFDISMDDLPTDALFDEDEDILSSSSPSLSSHEFEQLDPDMGAPLHASRTELDPQIQEEDLDHEIHALLKDDAPDTDDFDMPEFTDESTQATSEEEDEIPYEESMFDHTDEMQDMDLLDSSLDELDDFNFGEHLLNDGEEDPQKKI